MKYSNFHVLIKDLDDNRNQIQKEIQDLVSSFDPLSSSTSTLIGKIKMPNHQLKKLKDEEGQKILSMLELQCYLAPIIDFMQLNINEVDHLIHAPDCKTADDMEVFIAVLHDHFTTMKQIQSLVHSGQNFDGKSLGFRHNFVALPTKKVVENFVSEVLTIVWSSQF